MASYRLSVFKLLSIIYRFRSMFFFFFLFWSVNFLVPAIQARQKSEFNSNFNPKTENKKTAVIDRGWFNQFFCFMFLSGWVQKSRFESWLNVSIFTIFSLPFFEVKLRRISSWYLWLPRRIQYFRRNQTNSGKSSRYSDVKKNGYDVVSGEIAGNQCWKYQGFKSKSW